MTYSQARPKQLLVLSGKGGTGKTTVLGSFAVLAENKVMADCDVDASNLHLLLHPQQTYKEDYINARIAVRDANKCTKQGVCQQVCRFDAITPDEIDIAACEGCGFCVLACPEGALHLETIKNGELYEGETKYGPMVYARLMPAAENSGRLVTQVRKRAEDLALRKGLPLIIIDGPPGLGCTVTAALTDVDYVLLVTEPTLSGLHDVERVVQLIEHFDLPAGLVVNKSDINPEHSNELENFAKERELDFYGRLPFDEIVVEAVSQGVPLVEYTDHLIAKQIGEIWQALLAGPLAS